jgi:hypothetical protein
MSDTIYYVYAYLREDGSPYYIGKGVNDRAYRDHGKTPVPQDKSRIQFLHTNLTETEAFDLEIELISQYGRKDIGTGILRNLTNGGEGASGYIKSEETKQKISESVSAHMKSDETRRKISESLKGRKRTEETKQKISESLKGGKHSEETKRKIGEASRNIKKVYREFTCPHCNYTGRGGNMKRYHFDNCKRNPESAN